MVAHRPSRPSSQQNRFRLSDDLTERSCSERALHEFKVIATVKMLSSLGVLSADTDHLHIGNLTDQISIVILIDDGPELSQQLQRASLVPGMDQLLPIEWIIRQRERQGILRIRVQWRIISQFRIMRQRGDGVEA